MLKLKSLRNTEAKDLALHLRLSLPSSSPPHYLLPIACSVVQKGLTASASASSNHACAEDQLLKRPASIKGASKIRHESQKQNIQAQFKSAPIFSAT